MRAIVTSGLTNDELAAICKTKPQSITWRLCKYGSYYGLIPRKLPNRRLVWDRDEVMGLLRKSGVSI
jgi:hypothetical protein